MNAAFTEAQQRWHVFLGKIELRFEEVLTQAEEVLPEVLEFQDFDTTSFSVAWQGVESQIKILISKIGETWHGKVSQMLEVAKDAGEARQCNLDVYYKNFYELYYIEQSKGYAVAHTLEKKLKQQQVRMFSVAARKLRARASELLSKEFRCTQCQAALPVRENFFRSYYQTCLYCETVNTFEPGTIARNVEHFALHPLAEEQALEEYFVYVDLYSKFNSQQNENLEPVTVEAVLETYKRYAEKYLHARISIIPEFEKEFSKDLRAMVEHVRRDLCSDQSFINPYRSEEISIS